MSPRQVALLVGIPVSAAGFRLAWERGSDYLRELCAAYRDPTQAWEAYGESARTCERICRDCAGLGATVVLDATLADLAEQVTQHEVTIVIAHLAFPGLSAADVRDESGLLARVASGPEPEFALLRAVLPNPFGLADVLCAVDSLLKATQRQLSTAPISDLRDAEVVARQRGARLAEFGLLRLDRPRLDELCGERLLAPGRGIELSGQHITAGQFVAAIPMDYSGMIDLRMCSSLALGAALRRARPDCRIAISKRPAHPTATLVLVKSALVCMSQADKSVLHRKQSSSHSYEQAMRLVIDALRPMQGGCK